MANKSKAKGTTWETAIVNYLQSLGVDAKRKVLSGKEDKGDIELPTYPFLVIEAKNSGRYSFPEWVAEAEIEAENANADIGVVWAHRQRKSSPEDGFVVLSGRTFMKLLQRL